MTTLKKIEIDDFNSFQKEIEKSRNGIDRTINLTWFYIQARFRISSDEFKDRYSVDGKNDGGIDSFFKEGNTHYIIQSKYHENSQRESESSINDELHKIEKTLIGENSNKYADGFVNALIRDLTNSKAYLEIIWLTTNEVTENVRTKSKSTLEEILARNKWEIIADINFIDRYSLESVIYDIKHGYVPHTGKKELNLEPDEYMKVSKDRNNIEAFVCNIKATEILNWFDSSNDIETYLQKNVRGSVGETAINKALQKSFKDDPTLFWYKHNGIIIFADWLELNEHDKKLIIRNPQIVNGGQTVTQLYKAFDQKRSENNPSKIIVRIYRLPYEDAETYKRSIDIIAALNSQNKIKSSDLHSTDPCQVMLENRISDLGLYFRYFRKRSEKNKNIASWYNIFMVRLAMIYHVCEYRQPDKGVEGNIESYFEEEKKYNESFPEKLIKRALTNTLDHIVFKYIDSWFLFFWAHRYLNDELNKSQQELFEYLKWYVIVDTYQQLQDWKEKYFNESWREWTSFIDTKEYGNAILKYMKFQYPKYFSMIPKREQELRNYLKSSEARSKFIKVSSNQFEFKKKISVALDIYKRKRGY